MHEQSPVETQTCDQKSFVLQIKCLQKHSERGNSSRRAKSTAYRPTASQANKARYPGGQAVILSSRPTLHIFTSRSSRETVARTTVTQFL